MRRNRNAPSPPPLSSPATPWNCGGDGVVRAPLPPPCCEHLHIRALRSYPGSIGGPIRWTDRQTEPVDRSVDRSNRPLGQTATDMQLWLKNKSSVFFFHHSGTHEPILWRSLFYGAAYFIAQPILWHGATIDFFFVVFLAAAVRAYVEHCMKNSRNAYLVHMYLPQAFVSLVIDHILYQERRTEL